MSTIRAAGLGTLTASNTATIVDPQTPTNGIARVGTLVSFSPVSVSGQNIDFTNIPSWVRRITIGFSSMSTSGTNDVAIRLGTASGIETTGYSGSISSIVSGSSPGGLNPTAYAQIVYTASAGASTHGTAIVTLISSSTNLWVVNGVYGRSDGAHTGTFGFSKSLSGTLTQLRVFTGDTFDAGTLSCFYE
jgi:hypothetical protein